MATRIKPKLYVGSLQENFWGYIVKSEFHINSKDLYAVKFLVDYKRRMFGKHKQKKLHPNFEQSIKPIIGLNNHSYIQYTWVNDISYKFYLHYSRNVVADMYNGMKLINEIVDNQRVCEELDDEYEDEEKELR